MPDEPREPRTPLDASRCAGHQIYSSGISLPPVAARVLAPAPRARRAPIAERASANAANPYKYRDWSPGRAVRTSVCAGLRGDAPGAVTLPALRFLGAQTSDATTDESITSADYRAADATLLSIQPQ